MNHEHAYAKEIDGEGLGTGVESCACGDHRYREDLDEGTYNEDGDRIDFEPFRPVGESRGWQAFPVQKGESDV